jgi:hypothetical protein
MRFTVVLAKKTIFILLVLSLAVVFYGQPAQAAPLVTNGSFENGSFSDNTGDDTMNLSVGSTAMTGWTVTDAKIAWIGPLNPFELSASEGSYFLDLTGYHDSTPYGGVAQQNISTLSGGQYKLEFDLGSSTKYVLPSAITASAGLNSHLFTSTLSSLNGWEHCIMFFTASGTSTTISLTGSTAGGQYIGLDNVSVSFVPLPSTVLLLGSGLVGLGLLRRKWGMRK